MQNSLQQLTARGRSEVRIAARLSTLGRSYSCPINEVAHEMLKAYRWRVEFLSALLVRRNYEVAGVDPFTTAVPCWMRAGAGEVGR